MEGRSGSVDMKVKLGSLGLSSPVVTASGTFGYGTEYAGVVDYSKLGAVTAKGICLEPWPGNAMPRHAEVPGGLVNAIGLQGVGVKAFLDVQVPWYRENVSAALIAKAAADDPAREAIVSVRNTPLYSLPSAESGRVEQYLKAGAEVSIEENRMDWVRVRLENNDEGWVRGSSLAPLWSASPGDLVIVSESPQ